MSRAPGMDDMMMVGEVDMQNMLDTHILSTVLRIGCE